MVRFGKSLLPESATHPGEPPPGLGGRRSRRGSAAPWFSYQFNDIDLGSEIEGSDSQRANLDLVELMIHNRVLADVDRASVNDYLPPKYNLKQIFSLNEAPVVRVDRPKAGTVLFSTRRRP